MPLFFQLTLDPETRLAVWHLTEDEAFFRSLAVPQREVGHPHKRLQHLGGRFLLRHLFPEFPMDLIRIADTRKPFLEDEAFHFSISHCSDYAAAVVSRTERVGVDIEVITEKAARIRQKFASDAEWNAVAAACIAVSRAHSSAVAAGACLKAASAHEGLAAGRFITEEQALVATLIWSCKEAVFKWYGAGEVDFKGHIVIRGGRSAGGNTVELEVIFQKKQPVALVVHSRLLGDLWLSYVAG